MTTMTSAVKPGGRQVSAAHPHRRPAPSVAERMAFHEAFSYFINHICPRRDGHCARCTRFGVRRGQRFRHCLLEQHPINWHKASPIAYAAIPGWYVRPVGRSRRGEDLLSRFGGGLA